jgi:DNA-binding CsgD family transcriptional regulator
MTTERARTRCRERVAELSRQPEDAFEVRFAIIGVLRPVIGFERWCWPLTDPTSGLGTSAIGEHDYWPQLTRLLLLDQRVEEPNALPALAGSQALSETTRGRYSRSLRFTDVLDPSGIGDELRLPLRDRHGLWGCLDLMRDAADRPFAPEDRQLLDALAPTLASVARRSAAMGAAAGPPSVTPPAAGVVVLDDNLDVRAMTRPARDWLAQMQPPAHPFAELAARAVICNVASRAIAHSDGYSPLGAARARVRVASGAWAVVEGEPLDGSRDRAVAVTIRPAAPEEILDLRYLAHDLTPRERQLVTLLLGGLDTRAITERMFVSPHTVQDHLKSVCRKVGVKTRKELIATLAGPGSAGHDRPMLT